MQYRWSVLFLVSSPVWAGTGIEDFLSWITGWGEDIYATLTVGVPGMMHRFSAYLVELWVVVTLYLQLEAMEFSWLVAKEIMADLHFSESLNAAMGHLSPNTRAMIGVLNLDFALESLLTARLTRFVMGLF